MLGLAEALRRFGLTVELVPGWETRGSAVFNPGGSVGHHTAGSSRGTRPSLNICVNGRTDLPGPLCNTFTDRNGVAIVVASGRANHAGPGNFRGLVGNSSVLGHEAEDEGDGQWTEAQRWAFPRVHAAHLWLLGRDASWYCSHRTYATPPGRKPDPAGLADVDIQRQIHALLTNTTTTTEDDMTPEQSAKLDRIHFELTNPFQSRVAGSDFRDTAVGMVLNTDASQWRTERGVQQLLAEHAALRAAVAALAGGDLTPEQVTTAAKDGALAALDERISEARVEITPKETA